MENMENRGKEPPTGKTKLAVEPVSKIPKIKPEGWIVFIEHLPPRTSPRVSLPRKEENEDNNAKASRTFSRKSLPIKEENEYNNTKEPRTSPHGVSLSIKEE